VSGLTEVVQWLLESGADPNEPGKVRVLLNAMPQGGMTPVFAASAVGNSFCLLALLEHGAEPLYLPKVRDLSEECKLFAHISLRCVPVMAHVRSRDGGILEV
jgi:hypothetical protein